MPQMTVFWNSKKYPRELLRRVLHRVPGYAAEALSVEGSEHGKLTAEDFMVKVEQPGDYDRNWPGLGIVIEANLFPEREANLDERNAQIAHNLEKDGLAEGLDNDTSFVWTRLSVAGYTELGRKKT